MKCWICNINEANSEEHKFKASDIKRNFGKKFEGIYYNGGVHSFTSDKDKNIKFPKIICIDCNNNKTRRADDAYTEFTENYEAINSEIECKGRINFEKIYGDCWNIKKLDLYRYFAKHAGCKIITNNIHDNIDLSKLSQFILGGKVINSFYIKIYYNGLIKAFTDVLKTADIDRYKVNLAFGKTVFHEKDNNLFYCGSIIIGSLRIEWFYSVNSIFNREIKFDNVCEKVNVINNKCFYPVPFSNFINEEFMTYLNYGKYYLNEELEIPYFISKLKDISNS
ncbi:hypothetical protein [Elizabethkingia miricola]|uniref:hypothetical protein n=1 Tax=Elizabethkingia miricola TaxID=172045 RepID=UPI0038915B44